MPRTNIFSSLVALCLSGFCIAAEDPANTSPVDACTADAAFAEEELPASIDASVDGLQMAQREVLGDGLYGRVHVYRDTQYFFSVENMRHGAGQGENFTLWERSSGETPWKKRALFREHHPGMVSMLPLGDGELVFLYVDRKDERNRAVHLVRVADQVTPLWTFQDNQGVLNPVMDALSDGTLHILIPDRTGRLVRRFLVDPATGEQRRLPDIETPRSGARIYDRLIESDRLLVPLAVVHELLLMVIDLNDHGVTMHSLDRFTSNSGEPPRNMSFARMDDPDLYSMVYLRPAEFSDRAGRQGPRTGLVGEVVLSTLDPDSLETVGSTVIAGFSPQQASTHNFATARAGAGDILLAFTTVDRIHVRHLTARYENYTGAALTRWRVQADGTATRVAELEMKPFYSANMAPLDTREVLFSYNEARPGAPRVISRVIAK